MKVIQKYKYWKYSNLSMLQMSVQMYDLYIQMPNFILKKIILMYKSQFMEACLRHTLGYYLKVFSWVCKTFDLLRSKFFIFILSNFTK